MAINSKRKGRVGESELAHELNSYGYECRRTAQYCGKTGDAADVIGLNGIHIEVKRNERLNVYEAMAQAKRDCKGERIPTVMWRKNREEWLVTMRLEDWIKLYGDWKGAEHERETL